MDLHRLAEERSLAYHRVIAERLRTQPKILGALHPQERWQIWRETRERFEAL